MAISPTTQPARDQPAAGRLTSLLNQRVEDLRRREPGKMAAQRSLVAAMFGFFFRLVILLAVIEVAIIWLTSAGQNLQGQPLDYVLRYAIWLGIGQSSFYPAVDELLQANQTGLPFLLPVVLSAALMIYFLPSINAARRKSSARFAVYLINLFAGWSGIGWIMALIASFAGGQRLFAMTPSARGGPARSRRSILPSTGATSVKMGSSATVRTSARKEPAVLRRGSSGSWVRPR